nr:vacuolar protein sorting-associated protein 2 homolog 1-like [Tanacetum cinerariifolium]
MWESKRMIDKCIREIERERQGLQAQEKKLIIEIKKSANQGQMAFFKVMMLLKGEPIHYLEDSMAKLEESRRKLVSLKM